MFVSWAKNLLHPHEPSQSNVSMKAEKIKHLIGLMMENRSFDHYLGALTLPPHNRTDVNGLARLSRPSPSNPDNGGTVSSWAMDGFSPGYLDPPHGWDDAHTSWDWGANDRFIRAYNNFYPASSNPTTDPRIPMGYYTEKTLPVYYALAETFTVCDAWFGSVLISMWTNRKYLHSGRRDDDRDTQTIPGFTGFRTTPIYNAIEDSPNPAQPGNNLSWKCYFSDLPFLGFWYEFAAAHVIYNFAGVDEFLTD